MSSAPEDNSLLGESTDDEADWEQVEVAPSYDHVPPDPGPSAGIEITIHSAKGKKKVDDDKKKGISHAERLLRIDCHKIHTVALLANARVRNKWLNDPLLHARLMSLTPLPLQTAFAMITKARVPEAAKRGRLFESAVTRLAEWWAGFFDVLPDGHLRNRTFDEVQTELARKDEAAKKDRKGKRRARDTDDSEDELYGEVVRSEKSLMKHALMREGSRDVSAQLFTALCRALSIPARLVVSLQSVPWKAAVGKPKAAGKKGKGKAKGADEEDAAEESAKTWDEKQRDAAFQGPGARLDGANDASSSRKSTPSRSPVKLRKSKPQGRKLNSAPRRPPVLESPDPLTTPPVFWTEVFSRADGRWIPVDSVRCIVGRRKAFDPAPLSASSAPAMSDSFAAAGAAELLYAKGGAGGKVPRTRVENRMTYVVALEEDGNGRDVTARYARQYGAQVAKMRGREVWWEGVLALVTRPYRLQRDEVEDAELQSYQLTEAMPTSMIGFKDHPLYVLERHLRRDEVIEPRTELGSFRGEPVFSRANVLTLKTAENWMRSGRRVKEGAQPMKWVKQHAVTVHKRRVLELAAEGGDTLMQGLYARGQTEIYRADPVVDGKIPKNDFGNIDLYVPSMLPAGSVHVPYKGTAKIARQLGFDYAEAVTGFEFRKQKATPVITGIVIAAENEEAFLEAYWEAENEAAEKARRKKRDEVLKRWTRLVQGLRIRKRLAEQYADRGRPNEAKEDAEQATDQTQPEMGGGFLTEADDVLQADAIVQPFHLPKYQYSELHPLARTVANRDEEAGPGQAADAPNGYVLEADAMDDDDADMEEVTPTITTAPARTPITMEELAVTSVVKARPAASSSTPRKTTNPPPLRRTSARAAGKKRAKAVEASSEDETEGEARPTPAKRKRAAPPVADTPTRVLRTRRGKSEAQVKEEADADAAYMKAVAK